MSFNKTTAVILLLTTIFSNQLLKSEDIQLLEDRQSLQDKLQNKINNNYSIFYDTNIDGQDLIESLPSYIVEDILKNPDNYAAIYFESATILIQLNPEEAPITVNAFKDLVKSGFYNNTDVFRIIPNYFIQAGDPSNSRYGISVPPRKKESNQLEFERGSIAMANNGEEYGEANQFFITFNSFDWLQGTSTIFGKVISGIDFLESLSGNINQNGDISSPIPILSIKLLSNNNFISPNNTKSLEITDTRQEQREERRKLLEQKAKELEYKQVLEDDLKRLSVKDKEEQEKLKELEIIRQQIESNRLNKSNPTTKKIEINSTDNNTSEQSTTPENSGTTQQNNSPRNTAQ